MTIINREWSEIESKQSINRRKTLIAIEGNAKVIKELVKGGESFPDCLSRRQQRSTLSHQQFILSEMPCCVVDFFVYSSTPEQ